jgi:hypothetical protein
LLSMLKGAEEAAGWILAKIAAIRALAQRHPY